MKKYEKPMMCFKRFESSQSAAAYERYGDDENGESCETAGRSEPVFLSEGREKDE